MYISHKSILKGAMRIFLKERILFMGTIPLLSLDSLPELLSSNDLVQMGLFSSVDQAYLARIRGKSPDFIKFKRKVLYPKESVVEFIKKHFHKGDTTQADSTITSTQDGRICL